MKKVILITTIFFSLSILFLTNCQIYLTEEFANFLFNAVMEAAPTFEPTLSKGGQSKGTWESGYPMYQLFLILRDYEYPRDEGKIDNNNIYKVIHDIGKLYGDATSVCQPITEKVIDSPYDFGNSVTYNRAANETDGSDGYTLGYAIKEEGSIKYSLLTMHTAVGLDSYDVMQSSYDEATGEVDVDMANLVDYGAGNYFAIRLDLSGNVNTHEFSLRFINYSSGGYQISLVGKGISKGSGNYFLFKVKDSNTLLIEKYFCFPADADEDTLREMSDEGSDTPDAYCVVYQPAVDVMAFFEEADVPKAVTEFTNSSIFLDF
jgi:hypothetical protein